MRTAPGICLTQVSSEIVDPMHQLLQPWQKRLTTLLNKHYEKNCLTQCPRGLIYLIKCRVIPKMLTDLQLWEVTVLQPLDLWWYTVALLKVPSYFTFGHSLTNSILSLLSYLIFSQTTLFNFYLCTAYLVTLWNFFFIAVYDYQLFEGQTETLHK